MQPTDPVPFPAFKVCIGKAGESEAGGLGYKENAASPRTLPQSGMIIHEGQTLLTLRSEDTDGIQGGSLGMCALFCQPSYRLFLSGQTCTCVPGLPGVYD